MKPLSREGHEVLDGILVVLLHHGGRVQSEALMAILQIAHVPVALFGEAVAHGVGLELFDEIGDVVFLCRNGWERLAAEAEPLPTKGETT